MIEISEQNQAMLENLTSKGAERVLSVLLIDLTAKMLALTDPRFPAHHVENLVIGMYKVYSAMLTEYFDSHGATEAQAESWMQTAKEQSERVIQFAIDQG